MGEQWTQTTWGALATLEYGRALTDRPKFGMARAFGTNGPIGWANDLMGPGPTVIIGRKGAYRGVHYSPGSFWVIDTAYWLKPSKPIDMRWAYYQLLTVDINGRDSGSAIPSLSRQDFYGIPVSVPTLAEQCAIADVLGALDDKIENCHILAEAAERLAVARLSSLSTGASVGMIAAIDRRSVTVSEFESVEVEHFSLPAFDAGRVPARCPGSSIRSNKFSISEPSVLISKLNPHTPRVWHAVPSGDAVALSSTEFVVLRPTGDVSSQELWAVAATDQFSSSLGERVTGTTGSHQRVRPEDVLNVPVADPRRAPRPVRAAIKLLVNRAAAARTEIPSLARLRDTLLPALISGELRVREVEALVPDGTAE